LRLDVFSLSEGDSNPESDEEDKLTELAASLLVLIARDRVSPVALEGESGVTVESLVSAEGPSLRYAGGTTVPEPDVSSVGIEELVSVAGVGICVPE
jgi:hypothetical protein